MPQHFKCLATVIYDLPLITIPLSKIFPLVFWH